MASGVVHYGRISLEMMMDALDVKALVCNFGFHQEECRCSIVGYCSHRFFLRACGCSSVPDSDSVSYTEYIPYTENAKKHPQFLSSLFCLLLIRNDGIHHVASRMRSHLAPRQRPPILHNFGFVADDSHKILFTGGHIGR